MFKEFKNFIAKGNVMDLAVGMIIGSAFTGIVKSLTTNLINPLIGIFLGKINLSSIIFTVGHANFKLGNFIDSIINFLIIAFVIFLLVKFVNKVTNRQPKVASLSTSEQLLTDIKGLLEQSQDGSNDSAQSSQANNSNSANH